MRRVVLIALVIVVVVAGGVLAVRPWLDGLECKYGEGAGGRCVVPRNKHEAQLAELAMSVCHVIGPDRRDRKEFVSDFVVQRPGVDFWLTATEDDIADLFASRPQALLFVAPLPKRRDILPDTRHERELVRASCLEGFEEAD